MEPRTSIAWEPLASLGCGLAFQWVDVTRVQPGIYRLRAEADPDGAVREEQEANSPSFGEVASTITGYVAQPVTQQGAPADGRSSFVRGEPTCVARRSGAECGSRG